MNLDLIKSKLSSLNKTDNREKIDYEAIFWKPALGKHQVRIVPSAYNPEYPFSELRFHYKLAKFPMIALSNFGKQDPVEEFVKKLKSEGYDKERWSMAGKISPQLRVLAPVIVRGEESKGVRLWDFGTTIHKALLSLAEDEDIGDYTDPINGYDMIVEKTPGTPFAETTVRIKPKMVPLSTDASQAEMWLKNQPNPLESYNQYDYDFIKNKLMAFLSPEDSESADPLAASVTSTPTVVASTPSSAAVFELEGKPKVNTNSSFDSLFED